MNIEDMIKNGATPEEVQAAISAAYAEKERADKEKAKKANKEQLKAEARAYVINAIIAYGEAFDIEEMKDLDEEDIKELETLIKKIEDMYPTYLQLWKKQKEFEDGFKFGFGLGGF